MEQQEKIELSKSEDRKELLFYTNNNSLKVYLSRDSIVCNDRMETNNYENSFSNYMNNGLLITHRKISEDSIIRNLVHEESMRPIILALNFDNEDALKIPALIIDDEFNARWATIKEYNRQVDLAAFIIGQIPFTFVSGIHFNNIDDRQAFYSLLQNVSYPDELYRENFNILLGEDIEIDSLRLQSVVIHKLAELDINIPDALFVVHVRDRIKAMILSVISSFEVSSGFYKINFDQLIMEVIGEKLSDVLKVFKATDTYISDEEIVSSTDSTPFIAFIKILENIVNGKDEDLNWIKDLKQNKNSIPKEEIVGYYLAIKSLINENSKSYHNLKWFEDFKVIFINALIEIKSSKEMLEKYKNKINWLTEILDGKGRISDFLNDKESESKLLNGLILFVKDSVGNDSNRLMADMDNFKFSTYEKRMTWVLYGALKGTAFLGKEMKSNALLNRISDEVSLILTATEFMISDVCSLETYKKYRIINESIIVSKKGYPLITKKEFNSEVCFKYINDYISQKPKAKNNNKKKLLESLNQSITIPDKYYRYTYTLPKVPFAFKQDNERLILISPVKAIEIKEFSEEEYTNQVLKSPTNFSIEYEKQKENWEKLINVLQGK